MFDATMLRHAIPELMDEPGLDRGRHHRALRGLSRINFVSASANILWKPLARIANRMSGRPLRVLDVATASGDVPIRLWKRARRRDVALEIDGCDRSATALEFARCQAKRSQASVRFFEFDALCDEFPPGYDAITCSLFLHHLSEGEAIGFLARASRAAAQLVLVNDLSRSRLGLAMAHIAPWLLWCGPIVRVDAPRSVRASYTPAEVLDMADRAGLNGATIGRHWPCRFLLSWERHA